MVNTWTTTCKERNLLNRSNAEPSSKKLNAVLTAIRPGADVATAVTDSWNISWSIPRSLLKPYSSNVNNPMSRTTAAQHWIRWIDRRVGLCNCHKEAPLRIKPIAVFAFMVTHIGNMLFNAAISNIQPTITTKPINVTRILAILETDRSENSNCV